MTPPARKQGLLNGYARWAAVIVAAFGLGLGSGRFIAPGPAAEAGLGQRVSSLEAREQKMAERLNRIEAKLDVLLLAHRKDMP